MANKTHTHVDPETMLALLESRLPKEQSAAIGHHIGKCDQCMGDLWAIRGILNESVLPPILRALGAQLVIRGLEVIVVEERGR